MVLKFRYDFSLYVQNLQKRIKKKKGQNRDCELPAQMAFFESPERENAWPDTLLWLIKGNELRQGNQWAPLPRWTIWFSKCKGETSDLPTVNLGGETFPGPYLISLFHTPTALKALLVIPAQCPARHLWVWRTHSSSGDRCRLSSNRCL